MKNRKTLYTVLSFAIAIVPIALDWARTYLRTYYSRTFNYPGLMLPLVIVTPIINAMLVFAKIILHEDVPVRYSRIINIAATVVFVIGSVLIYHSYYLLSFISAYPMLTLIFGIQLCCLVYDFFIKREKRG